MVEMRKYGEGCLFSLVLLILVVAVYGGLFSIGYLLFLSLMNGG